jgi:hypothetical protein
MLHENYDLKGSVGGGSLVMILKGLGVKIN